MLPGISGIPAAGEERVPDGDASQAATTASPRLRAMLRSRAQIADRIAEGLLKVLDLRLSVALAALPAAVVSLLPELREARGTVPVGAIATLIVATAVGFVVGFGLMTVLIPALRRFGGRVVAVAATAGLLALAAGVIGAVLGRGSLVATTQRGLWAAAIFFLSFLVIAQGLYLA